MESFRERMGWFLKGMGMGAADVVPGVSGGTIAFITGIYERLIDSLKSFDAQAFRYLFSADFRRFWKHINGRFLLTLFSGIVFSVLTLVRLIHYLLDNHAVPLWSFFFGLIVTSAFVVGLKVRNKNLTGLIFLIAGAFIAWWVGISTPAETPESLWFIFLSGALAICAMILPGISGSFILLLLKKYAYVTGAIKDLELLVIGVFMAGCAVGLLSFARLLGYLFKKYHDATVSLMTGFMIGSLQVVWPWKKVIETRVDSHGEVVPFRYESVAPGSFEGDPQLGLSIFLCISAVALIIGLERLGRHSDA